MTQQQQSREFDVSDLSSIPWLGKRKEFDAISGPEERVVWHGHARAWNLALNPPSWKLLRRLSLCSIFSRSFNWYIWKKIENATLQSLGCKIIQTINERKDKRDTKWKKIKNLSTEGRRELWPPQEGGGGGLQFSNKNWEGGYNFYHKIFLGGLVLKHYTFLKTTAPPPPPPHGR